MSRLDARLKRLERQSLPDDTLPKVILRTLVRPSEGGPVPCGAYYSVIGGATFKSADYESEEALLQAVDQEHRRIYAKPYMERPT